MAAETEAGALQDVDDVIEEWGTDVKILAFTEDKVTRDEYGSIIKREVPPLKTTKAFPIRFNPTEKDRMKAGITEKTDVIFWLSTQKLAAISLSFEEVDLVRSHLIYNSVEYSIKQKGQAYHHGDSFLYLTLACSRK